MCVRINSLRNYKRSFKNNLTKARAVCVFEDDAVIGAVLLGKEEQCVVTSIIAINSPRSVDGLCCLVYLLLFLIIQRSRGRQCEAHPTHISFLASPYRIKICYT